MTSYQIQIKALRLYAYHGAFAEERKLGQEFEIDLDLVVTAAAPLRQAKLEEIVSYADVLDLVQRHFTAQTYHLLENVGQVILDELSKIPLIQEARLEIRKPHPPIPASISHVGVTLTSKYPKA